MFNKNIQSFYHCISCHSRHVAKACLKLDYLGIVCNITATCISATYFGLYDHRQLAMMYIAVIAVFGTMTFLSMLDSNADGTKSASWRLVNAPTLSLLAIF